MAALDLCGLSFGRLRVVEFGGSRSQRRYWRCVCECGGTAVCSTEDLRKGNSRSCGCMRIESARGRLTKHGMSGTRLHNIWRAMKERCYNERNVAYKTYGGRGITVCQRWRESFEAFVADMASTYQPGLTIERKDVNGNYEPGNCVWATAKEQSENTRRNVYYDTPAGRLMRREAVKLLGIPSSTFQSWERSGKLPWSRAEVQ